jgi:hypothetical protein
MSYTMNFYGRKCFYNKIVQIVYDDQFFETFGVIGQEELEEVKFFILHFN